MSKKPNDPDDEKDDDGFDEDRLNSAEQGKQFKDAQKCNTDAFTSFSEGMPAIDKFKIMGATGEHLAVRTGQSAQTKVQSLRAEKRSVMRAAKLDSFTSFSEGLPSADKFSIPELEEEKFVGIDRFFDSTSCSFIAQHRSDRNNGDAHQAGESSDDEKTDFTSKTLDRLIFLLDKVPWKETLCVEVSNKPEFKEFCFDEDTMMLDKNFDEEQTVIAFAHQSYHATNKLLTKLYDDDDDDEMLDRETFIDLYLWAEVAALITEINVRRELGLWKVAPPKVLCQENDGSIFSINVEDLLKSKGMKALHDLLYHSILRGSDNRKLTDVYGRLFDVYQQNFQSEKSIAHRQIDLCLAQGLEKDCI